MLTQDIRHTGIPMYCIIEKKQTLLLFESMLYQYIYRRVVAGIAVAEGDSYSSSKSEGW